MRCVRVCERCERHREAGFGDTSVADATGSEQSRARFAMPVSSSSAAANPALRPASSKTRESSVRTPAARPQSVTHCKASAAVVLQGMRGPNRKYGTPVSGWQQKLVSRIGVPDHAALSAHGSESRCAHGSGRLERCCWPSPHACQVIRSPRSTATMKQFGPTPAICVVQNANMGYHARVVTAAGVPN